MGKSNCPGQSKPEKICGTCRYFNPEFPVNGETRPGMFGVEDDKRGNGIHQPPWNPTAFSLFVR